MKVISESFSFVEIKFGAIDWSITRFIWSRTARIGIRDLADIHGILIEEPET